MSLKFRLALLYSFSVFIILLISAFSIIFLFENFRRDEFSKRVVFEAIENVNLYFSVPTPTPGIIDDLNKNAANSLPQEKIYIYDSAHNLLYATPNAPVPSIAVDQFETAKQKQIHTFSENNKECALILRVINDRRYYVFASANDIFGQRKSHNLKWLLFASVSVGLLLSAVLSFFYVRHVMRPLEGLKQEIEKIDEKNLKERIIIQNVNSEVGQIAKKFNEMLERLEQAFEQRKNFVQHASHELRTPLANMLAITESAIARKMPAEEYQKVLISLKEDQQDLIDLTNSLLTLSRYEKISFVADSTLIRVDEVLYETVDFAEQAWSGATVAIDFATVPENQSELELMGNEFLLKCAIHNLVKNGIYYSEDHKVRIIIVAEENSIILHFDNTGNPLTTEEQSKLFIPFFRGENTANKKGYGLGLSIVKRIVEVHNGSVSYRAVGDHINRFTVILPHRKS
ncbi:MAG: HAMP domain-containing sensor histidine kinase [Segetibacter sp.]